MDRIVRILDLLASNASIKTTLLAELLDVSQVTLRKDLDDLEKRGIVHRTHGFVSLEGADDTGKRLAINHSVKKRIAETAVLTVKEGETVMIESGSCCALFAEELALAQKNITIITNSVYIANYICKLQNIKIILLGGYFQPQSQVLVGPMTAKYGEMFPCEKYFLGTDGFIPEYGFTGRDLPRVETAQELAKHAQKVFVLTESAKFKNRGAHNLIQLNKLSGVFTDENIPKDAEAVLLENNVQVYKVPAD